MKIQQHKRCQNHEVLARAKPTGAERALHKEPESHLQYWPLCTLALCLGRPSFSIRQRDKNPTRPTPCRPAGYLPNLSSSHLCTAYVSVATTSARRGQEAASSLHTAQLDSQPQNARPGLRSVLRQTLSCVHAAFVQMGTHAQRGTHLPLAHSDVHHMLNTLRHTGQTVHTL